MCKKKGDLGGIRRVVEPSHQSVSRAGTHRVAPEVRLKEVVCDGSVNKRGESEYMCERRKGESRRDRDCLPFASSSQPPRPYWVSVV